MREKNTLSHRENVRIYIKLDNNVNLLDIVTINIGSKQNKEGKRIKEGAYL